MAGSEASPGHGWWGLMPLEVQGFVLAPECALEHRTGGYRAGRLQMNREILGCSEQGTGSPSLPQAGQGLAWIRAVLIHSRARSLIPGHDPGWQQSHQWGKRCREVKGCAKVFNAAQLGTELWWLQKNRGLWAEWRLPSCCVVGNAHPC